MMFGRESLKNINEYKLETRNNKIILDANENPIEMPKDLLKKVGEDFFDIKFNRYPDPNNTTIKGIISEKLHSGLSVKNIFVGNGSDEILLYIFMCFWGKHVLIPSITYPVYEHIARVCELDIEYYPIKEPDFDIHEDIIDIVNNKKPELVMLSYPNNPTGNCFDADIIRKLIYKNPETMFIIDEAYYHYSKKTFSDMVLDVDNVIIIRTMSKAYGLASIRIGYVLSNSQNIELLNKVKLPFNVNSISQTLFQSLFSSMDEWIKFCVEENNKEKLYMYSELKKSFSWIKLFPSEANFILIKLLDVDRNKLQDYLRKKSISLKYFKVDTEMGNYIRVTIGNRRENDMFLATLKEFEQFI